MQVVVSANQTSQAGVKALLEKEIAQNNNDAGSTPAGGELSSSFIEMGSALSGAGQQKLGHLGQIMSATHVGHLVDQTVGKRAESDTVVVDQANVGQSGGELSYGALLGGLALRHRCTGVKHDVDGQVLLLKEELQE